MTYEPVAQDAPAPSGAAAAGGLEELGVALTGVVAGLGAYGGGVYLIGKDPDLLVLTVLIGLPSQFAGPWLRIALGAPVAVADAVRGRELVWIGSEEQMAHRYPRTALTLPYQFASACVPLVGDDRVFGGLFVNWSGSHLPRLAGRERRKLEAAAAAMGRLLAEAERAGRPVRPGERPVILPDLPAGPGPRDQFAAAAARLPDGLCALDVDGRVTCVSPVAADLLGATPDELLGHLPWRLLSWLRHPMYEERYRAAAMSRQPTAFVALRPPNRWLSFRLYPDTTGITVLVSEARPEEERPPPEPPGAPTRAEAIYHILHLAAALTEAAGVGDIVDLVGDQLLPAVGGDRMVLLTLENDGRLVVAGSRGHPPAVLEHFERSGPGEPVVRSARARALTTGGPFFFESRDELLRVYPGFAPFLEMSAWVGLPLAVSGRPIGLCVLSFESPRRFSVDERTVLTALGGLIAQALTRARRYDTTRDVARNLQAALLPRALPAVPGLEVAARYRPAAEGMDVGGDFYDLIPLPGPHVAAVIGDVQGHNATAAALMGQLRTAIRAHATPGADPRRVLARTNQLLTDLDVDLFASAVHLHIDLRRGRALVARAGHPYPLLRHPDGGVEILEIPGGPLLGVDPYAAYPRARVCLPAGSVLALYTDGLIETPGADPDRALAGLARRLAEADPAERSLDDIAGSLVRRAPGNDDTALLLLRQMPRGSTGRR